MAYNVVTFSAVGQRVSELVEIFGGEIHLRGFHREVEQVVNDERRDDQPAHHHRARRIGRGGGCGIAGVGNRTGGAVFRREPDGRPDVQRDGQQQSETRGPDDFDVALEKVTVGIEHLGAEENLQIAGEMADDKQQQRGPGQGHE